MRPRGAARTTDSGRPVGCEAAEQLHDEGARCRWPARYTAVRTRVARIRRTLPLHRPAGCEQTPVSQPLHRYTRAAAGTNKQTNNGSCIVVAARSSRFRSERSLHPRRRLRAASGDLALQRDRRRDWPCVPWRGATDIQCRRYWWWWRWCRRWDQVGCQWWYQ